MVNGRLDEDLKLYTVRFEKQDISISLFICLSAHMLVGDFQTLGTGFVDCFGRILVYGKDA